MEQENNKMSENHSDPFFYFFFGIISIPFWVLSFYHAKAIYSKEPNFYLMSTFAVVTTWAFTKIHNHHTDKRNTTIGLTLIALSLFGLAGGIFGLIVQILEGVTLLFFAFFLTVAGYKAGKGE